VVRVRKQKEAPSDPAAAFYQLLDRLLKVTRQDIQEAFEPRGSKNSPNHSQGGVPERLSRTDNPD
jgi:hypothetical protein